MSGLFGTFNVAKRGMFVQQKTIDVTSHNIANANTEGYSRQRAIVETTRPFGMPSLNSVAEPGQLGTGAQISAIERVRDSFLDFQVRNETSTYGQYTARETYLSQIESILNEPSDTGLSTIIGKFYDSWQELSKQPQSSNARTVVAQQSLALTNELNHTYNQLEKLKTNAESSINQSITDVNSMLNQINQLNQQIVQVKVAGKMPNDLMDKRDLLLDKLSAKFNINIDKKALEGINLSTANESTNTDYNLVNAVITGDEKRFSYISAMEKKSYTFPSDVTVTYYKLGDMSTDSNKVTITMKDLTEAQYKEMDQCRTLWANNEGIAVDASGNLLNGGTVVNNFSDLKMYQPQDGELKGYMSIQNDVDKYIDEINRLTKAIAFSVNAVHSGTEDGTSDTLPFFANYSIKQENGEDPADYLLRLQSYNPTLTQDAAETATDYQARLERAAAEVSITAGNITVNKAIVSDVTLINTGQDPIRTKNGETDNKRALAIASLRDALIKIQDVKDSTTRDDIINFVTVTSGTDYKLEIKYDVDGMKVGNYFKNTVNSLGVQAQEATRMVTNQEALLSYFEESRASVSGVSLDEEMANLVQYQHAYNANAKMISTIDELLEVVVNGLKR